jgi:adenylosuccinate lyase
VAVALALRAGQDANDLLDRLAADPRLGLSAADLGRVLADPLSFTGAARDQTAAFVESVAAIVGRFPEAADYQPAPLL